MPGVRPPEFVDAWNPHIPGVREVFHARFVEHTYPLHTHDAWTVLLVDEGAVRYALDRHEHGTLTRSVAVLPPYVAHDGRAVTPSGFRKRVLYLDPAVVGDQLIGPAVDRPTVRDPALARSIGALHTSLLRPGDALEAETRVAFVAERLVTHLAGADDALSALDAGRPGASRLGREPVPHRPGLAEDLRDLLDADVLTSATLRELASGLGASPTHLVRAFTARFGVSPHAYLVGRRVELARLLLLEDEAPAAVAAAAGFHDQAHLTRHFRRHVGTTPGRFRRRAVARG